MTWRETVRDTLVGDCPPACDVEMPGDGARRQVGIRLLVVAIMLVAACAAVVLVRCST